VNIKIYVEGGGSGKGGAALDVECREGFRKFFESAGLKDRMPRISASGSRNKTYKKFCGALTVHKNEYPILLVDSEGPVSSGMTPWQHLKSKDNWDKPENVTDKQAHLMVQTMEAWIVIDRNNLINFFNGKFNPDVLPSLSRDIEKVPKTELEDSLKKATKDTTKGKYNKGRHSFELLGTTDPELVKIASPFAKSLIKTLLEISSQ